MTLRAPTSRVTVASYLSAERTAVTKSILWDFETFAMAGGTQQHNLLAAAMLRELGTRLRGVKTSRAPVRLVGFRVLR